VTRDSAGQAWFQKHFEYRCDDCGSGTGIRSRPRTFSEQYVLPFFLLQPVRCSDCFRRDYRLVFVPVKDRLPENIKKSMVSTTPPECNVA
jgi:hypothetical protein